MTLEELKYLAENSETATRLVEEYAQMIARGFESTVRRFIGGDALDCTCEWHEHQCRGLLTLCQLFGIPVSGLAMYGACPTVLVDRHPNWDGGTPGKFASISEFSPLRKGPTYFVAEFDLNPFGVPGHTRLMGDFLVEL